MNDMDLPEIPPRDPPAYGGSPNYAQTPPGSQQQIMSARAAPTSMRLLPSPEDDLRTYVSTSTTDPRINGEKPPKRKPLEIDKKERRVH